MTGLFVASSKQQRPRLRNSEAILGNGWFGPRIKSSRFWRASHRRFDWKTAPQTYQLRGAIRGRPVSAMRPVIAVNRLQQLLNSNFDFRLDC